MISTATQIEYDGESSEDYDIIRAYTSGLPSYHSGLIVNPQTQKILGIDKLFFYGIDKTPFTFDLELYKETIWTIQDRKDVYKWLYKNSFKDLVFLHEEDNPDPDDMYEDIVYNCMPIGEPQAIDYGGMYGVKIKFQNSLPYATTNDVEQVFDLYDNTTTTDITLYNYSNLNEYLYDIDIEFTLVGDSTGITLVNKSDENRTFSFTGLDEEETVTVSNLYGDIVSDTGENRYPNFNKTWFRIAEGQPVTTENILTITGKCLLTISARFPLII
jgi:hypothetical protein